MQGGVLQEADLPSPRRREQLRHTGVRLQVHLMSYVLHDRRGATAT